MQYWGMTLKLLWLKNELSDPHYFYYGIVKSMIGRTFPQIKKKIFLVGSKFKLALNTLFQLCKKDLLRLGVCMVSIFWHHTQKKLICRSKADGKGWKLLPAASTHFLLLKVR